MKLKTAYRKAWNPFRNWRRAIKENIGYKRAKARGAGSVSKSDRY